MNPPLTTNSPETRLHSMDGVRATMMLLGIFFHAAWFFIPTYFGHPITDKAANWGMSYFFYWTHTFRMQAFFLIAGFFACLLIEKRGVLRFVSNRLFRVAIPFVLSTVLLYPLMRYQMIVGGLQSGRIQSGETAWQLLVTELSEQKLSQLWPVHLWFLYSLLIMYAISLIAFVVFRFIVDRNGAIRRSLQSAFEWGIASPFGVLFLTLLIGLSLFVDVTWYGISAGPLDPKWTGVFAYWIFFAVGWCLYKKPELLKLFDRGCFWRLGVGTAISVALCMYANNLITTGRLQWGYPVMAGAEIRDYGLLRQKLLQARDEVDDSPVKIVWSGLSPEFQRFIEQTKEPTSDQLDGISTHISLTAFTNSALANAQLCENLPLEDKWQNELLTEPGERDAKNGMELNRKIVEAALAPLIVSRWEGPVWNRALYFFGYALTSWLLVFGTIGFFNRFITEPSPTFRYIGDSSYWLYLIHLPILFQLQLWLAPIEMHWLPKYALYLVISFAVMIPTYHYLVRSTWIGQLLNGRRYEFVSWFHRPPTSTL